MKLFAAVRPGIRTSTQIFRHRLILCAAMAASIIPSGLLAQQAPVNLGTAGDYVVLSKTGITDVPPAHIVGNIAASPITGAAIHVTCAEVTGTISSVDAAGPAPCSLIVPVLLTTAISDMQTAYTDAAGRTLPDFTEFAAGNISGKTLVPGLYKWSTSVSSDATGFTLSGGPNAVWIFQVAGDLNLANSALVTLLGGAQANNIFWQVAGPTGVTLGTGASIFGTLLSAKQVIMNTGAALGGRALAQTQVTLQSNSVTTPGPLVGGIPPTVSPTVTSTVPANLAVGVATNTKLSATFSEPMDPTTMNAATFTLKNGLLAVAGTVSYVGVTETFSPTLPLLAGTTYTATITTGAKDPAGTPLAANYVWTFTTGAGPSLTPPTVTFTVPATNATGVAVGNSLTATFSEAMDPATINGATFTLQQGATVIAGAVSYAGLTATFKPTALLGVNTVYTATVTTGAKSLSGNALASNYVWSFTTSSGLDTTPPTVVFTVPATNAVNVPVGNALAATFSKAMDPLTINTTNFRLQQGNTLVAGTVSYSGLTAVFKPISILAANAAYTAVVTSAVADLAGNTMATNYIWSFTTGSALDTTRPTVISTTPADTTTQVTTTSNVIANFSKIMDPLTVTTATFLLRAGTTPVVGTVTYLGTSATFRPTAALLPNTLYVATILPAAADLAGNTMLGSYIWTFTTGNAGGQTPVCLTNFAIFSGVGVNSSGASAVTGDIGVTAGGSVTGFPPATVKGTIFTGVNANVAQALIDFTAAYQDAASRTVNSAVVTGDIGGQTFTAGLYKSTSSLAITAADVILDAKGDANAIFVFDMASTLTTGAGRQVILTGGAQAFNVFWQVGTSATLGANSVLNGSILADQSITLGTGATVFGRLGARAGAVTLQSNTVTSPAPAITLAGIFSAASWGRTVAAGSIASVFGSNFGSSTVSATAYPLVPSLAGTSFRVGNQAGPLFMTSCSQVNLQIPWESAGQTLVPVTATVAGLVSSVEPAIVAPFAPGIFTMNQSGTGQGAVEIAATAQLAGLSLAGGRAVARGEYIAIYCTGLGAVSNQPATGAAALGSPLLSATTTLPVVTIGGAAAQVSFSGLAPGFAGLYQVNALVPAGAPSGNSVNLIMSIGGIQSNTVTIAVQ